MSFRLAAFVLVLCAVGYGQDNRIRPASRSAEFARTRGRPAPVYTPDCSATSQTPPHRADASPEDFIELERAPCFSECPSYSVRLYRTGRIDWQFGPRILSEQSAEKPLARASDAEALLSRASGPSFWSACEAYPAAEDSAIYNVRIGIGDRLKTIQAAYGTGLEWLDEFTSDLDRVVETHRWLRGDRAMGELGHMVIGSVIIHGGATPLMRAAATGDLDEIASLLAMGVPVDQQDANGWTALVYAAGAFQPMAVTALFRAGADPDIPDLHGHTPLLAGAYGVGFEELIAATRDINHKSKEGLSALMVLADRASLEKVRLALANGADRTLTSANGQSAWDFLMRSYCGPVLDARILSRLPGPSAEGRQQCIELDRLLKPSAR